MVLSFSSTYAAAKNNEIALLHRQIFQLTQNINQLSFKLCDEKFKRKVRFAANYESDKIGKNVGNKDVIAYYATGERFV